MPGFNPDKLNIHDLVVEDTEQKERIGRDPEVFLDEVFDWIEKNVQDSGAPFKKEAWGWRISENGKMVSMMWKPSELPGKFIDEIREKEPEEFVSGQQRPNGVGMVNLLKKLEGNKILSIEVPRKNDEGKSRDSGWYLEIFDEESGVKMKDKFVAETPEMPESRNF